ncbi:MAG: SAM-dependent methyltransferase, partial [Pseudomonadota bacterium]|nr:SAM-dependent methyltransferase [Pseudomonadota bacterium]
ALALYTPGLGYYASGRRIVGRMPGGGSDFVTAPELSPLFAQALSRQLSQALDATGSDELWEFGAGSGTLAVQLLAALGSRVRRYSIVELSAPLRARQAETTAGDARVRWLDGLPESMSGVVIGNEVLDAMPCELVHFDGAHWLQRGVVGATAASAAAASAAAVSPTSTIIEPSATTGPRDERFAWGDRPGGRAPPLADGFVAGTTTELHDQATAFVATLGERLRRGAMFLIDYGFPESEYYHPQRNEGTLMCHRGHRADTDPLADVGLKDITSHLDFTALAIAGQGAGLDVVGYTSQARFLLDCGLGELLAAADVRDRADALKLVSEHEMGELFKVIAFAKGIDFAPLGFASGDRRHRL